MKTLNLTAASITAILMIASLSSCAIPTVWEDTQDLKWEDTYVRVDVVKDNESRGLFQWYPEYQLGVSFRQFQDGSMVANQNNQNYIIDDHIESHSYDWERYIYYCGDWSNKLPLPTKSGETFDYACYAPYTNATMNDFDNSQSALCPGDSGHEGQLFYRQGSELGSSYDLIYASLDGINTSNFEQHITTGPLYFKAKHALAKMYFQVEGLSDRYELTSLVVTPSTSSPAPTQGYFDIFNGEWTATDATVLPQWSWSGIALSRTETTASTQAYPLYLLPSNATPSKTSGFDYELTLNQDGEITTITGSWNGRLDADRVYCLTINKNSGSANISSMSY